MRDLVTAALEVLGLLLVAGSAFLALAPVNVAGAVAASGVVLIAESALLSWRPRPRRPEVDVA